MAVSLMELLASYTQMGVYSHFTTPGERLQRFFGMNIGGPANNKQRGRMFMFRYFDHSRDVANFRAPGTGPATIKNQFIGQVTGTFGRIHEKKILEYETLGNLRPMENNSPLDAGGQQYIARQQKHLYQRFSNAREVMVMGMLRGGIQFLIQGEDLVPVYSGGDITINYNVPAGNLGSLLDSDGATIITATWANAATKIIDQLVKIEQTSEYNTGRPIRHVWTDSKVWNYVLNNTQVQQMGGTAATAFAEWTMEADKGADGKEVRYFNARLKGYPHILFHIYNAGLNIGTSGTFTRFFDGTNAVFVPDPDPDWVEMGEGSEYVVETPGAMAQEKVGFFAWGKTSDEPASIQLLAVDNAIPFLTIPKCVMHGTCVF